MFRKLMNKKEGRDETEPIFRFDFLVGLCGHTGGYLRRMLKQQ